MSKLNIDQKTIQRLFTDEKIGFLIPDYQRPYAWDKDECLTLWEDLFAFTIPNDDVDQFDSSEMYFLGPIVTFVNEDSKKEIIDGQQRLTTLLLLLRAFYDKFECMKDKKAVTTRTNIAECIWKTDEFDEPKMDELKIDSEVATDDDKEEFLKILKTGIISDGYKSNYAKNFQFFKEKIDEFISTMPGYFSYMPTRIMKNCILLPIEAESQDTALRIFSTLNDRGLPLSDADIFKAQFYKIYSSKEQKDEFIRRWKELEQLCNDMYGTRSGSPMDEIFTRYMYYERAKMGVKKTTTEALRKFYERDNYSLLKKEGIFEQIIDLGNFWNDVYNQSVERFSDKILKKLFVLDYAPNGMWTYFTSVYYMHNKDENGMLEEEAFDRFLDKTIAFIWTYAITNPGVNALRGPVYNEMIKIVNDEEVTFDDKKFDRESVRKSFDNFAFTNGRPITKSMLAWWMFNNGDDQELLSLETKLDVEHIFARNRLNKGGDHLSDTRNIESLGNKAFLEKKINIRASDYRFEDKKKYYLGFENSRKQHKEGTKNSELVNLANMNDDFNERDIKARKRDILDGFMEYLNQNNLLER